MGAYKYRAYNSKYTRRESVRHAFIAFCLMALCTALAYGLIVSLSLDVDEPIKPIPKKTSSFNHVDFHGTT